MLSTLLPGIREVRTPLVTGSLWLLAIVLVMQESVPPAGQATGLYKLGYNVHAVLGLPGVAASLGVFAYLMGTISSTLLVGGFPGGRLLRPHVRFVPRTAWLPQTVGNGPSLRAPFGVRGHRALLVAVRKIVVRMESVLAALAAAEQADQALRDRAEVEYLLLDYPQVAEPDDHHEALRHITRTRAVGPAGGETRARARVDGLVSHTSELVAVLRRADHEYRSLGPRPDAVPVRRTTGRSLDEPPSYWNVQRPARSMVEEAVADVIVADFEMMRTRLLRPETADLSSAIDRLRGEADLRFAVSAPLSALFCGLAVTTHAVAWLLALFGVVVLTYAAVQRRKDAGDMLLDALDEHTNSPALERLVREVDAVAHALLRDSEPVTPTDALVMGPLLSQRSTT